MSKFASDIVVYFEIAGHQKENNTLLKCELYVDGKNQGNQESLQEASMEWRLFFLITFEKVLLAKNIKSKRQGKFIVLNIEASQ